MIFARCWDMFWLIEPETSPMPRAQPHFGLESPDMRLFHRDDRLLDGLVLPGTTTSAGPRSTTAPRRYWSEHVRAKCRRGNSKSKIRTIRSAPRRRSRVMRPPTCFSQALRSLPASLMAFLVVFFVICYGMGRSSTTSWSSATGRRQSGLPAHRSGFAQGHGVNPAWASRIATVDPEVPATRELEIDDGQRQDLAPIFTCANRCCSITGPEIDRVSKSPHSDRARHGRPDRATRPGFTGDSGRASAGASPDLWRGSGGRLNGCNKQRSSCLRRPR